MPGTPSTPQPRIERAMRLRAGKPIDQYEETRRCAYPECAALLSRYNPNPTCGVHGGWADEPRGRSKPR